MSKIDKILSQILSIPDSRLKRNAVCLAMGVESGYNKTMY